MADRIDIVLVCTSCEARNYKTTKAPKIGAEPLEKKKYCPHCNKHTVHRESK